MLYVTKACMSRFFLIIIFRANFSINRKYIRFGCFLHPSSGYVNQIGGFVCRLNEWRFRSAAGVFLVGHLWFSVGCLRSRDGLRVWFLGFIFWFSSTLDAPSQSRVKPCQKYKSKHKSTLTWEPKSKSKSNRNHTHPLRVCDLD